MRDLQQHLPTLASASKSLVRTANEVQQYPAAKALAYREQLRELQSKKVVRRAQGAA